MIDEKEREAEDRIQSACYCWFHNTYPELRDLLNYNHNNPKNRIDGNKQKALGLRKGRSDLVFYFQKTAFMIEMKTPTGVQSKVQKAWQQKLESQGFTYFIVRTRERFEEIIKQIIKY